MIQPLILFTADHPIGLVSRLFLVIAIIPFAAEGMSFADDVGKSDGTALGDLAAKMKPGEWAELKTKNADLLHYGKDASYNLMEYADTACWDPKSKQFLFFGGSHYKTTARFVAYSAKTNSWRIIPHPFATGQSWHAYDMNAIDPIRGEFYIGEHRYRIADGKWSTLPAHGQNFGRGHTAVEYFPELDGLLFIANGQVLLFERKSKQWRTLASGLDQSESALHPLAAYSPVDKVVLFGGWGGTEKKNLEARCRRKSKTHQVSARENGYLACDSDGRSGQRTIPGFCQRQEVFCLRRQIRHLDGTTVGRDVSHLQAKLPGNRSVWHGRRTGQRIWRRHVRQVRSLWRCPRIPLQTC